MDGRSCRRRAYWLTGNLTAAIIGGHLRPVLATLTAVTGLAIDWEASWVWRRTCERSKRFWQGWGYLGLSRWARLQRRMTSMTIAGGGARSGGHISGASNAGGSTNGASGRARHMPRRQWPMRRRATTLRRPSTMPHHLAPTMPRRRQFTARRSSPSGSGFAENDVRPLKVVYGSSRKALLRRSEKRLVNRP